MIDGSFILLIMVTLNCSCSVHFVERLQYRNRKGKLDLVIFEPVSNVCVFFFFCPPPPHPPGRNKKIKLMPVRKALQNFFLQSLGNSSF